MLRFLTRAGCLFLAAGALSCAAVDHASPGLYTEHVVAPQRQSELFRLFDAAGAPPESAGVDAARAIVSQRKRDQGKRELDFIDALWGSRGSEPRLARRLGTQWLTLAEESLARGHDTRDAAAMAVLWFGRALKRAMQAVAPDSRQVSTVAPPEDVLRLRYLLARSWVVSDRADLAVELLANRDDTSPMPADMEELYEALLASIERTIHAPAEQTDGKPQPRREREGTGRGSQRSPREGRGRSAPERSETPPRPAAPDNDPAPEVPASGESDADNPASDEPPLDDSEAEPAPDAPMPDGESAPEREAPDDAAG